jgi:hypothetical protein
LKSDKKPKIKLFGDALLYLIDFQDGSQEAKKKSLTRFGGFFWCQKTPDYFDICIFTENYHDHSSCFAKALILFNSVPSKFNQYR